MNWNLTTAVALSKASMKPLEEENKKLIAILDQIQTDLADVQNYEEQDRIREHQLELFYDRMCANVTDYENLEK